MAVLGKYDLASCRVMTSLLGGILVRSGRRAIALSELLFMVLEGQAVFRPQDTPSNKPIFRKTGCSYVHQKRGRVPIP
jgi:hypothetical protein